MNLKQFDYLLKESIPKEMYNELEKNLDSIELSENKILYNNSKIGKDTQNLINALPSFYDNFLEIEKYKNKIKSSKYTDLFLKDEGWTVIVDGITMFGSLFGGFFHSMFTDGISPLFAVFASYFGLFLTSGLIGLNSKRKQEIGPMDFVRAGYVLCKNSIQKINNKIYRGKKIQKLEKKLKNNLFYVYENSISSEKLLYQKNRKIIENNSKLLDLFENKNNKLKNLLDIVNNYDSEIYKEKLNLITLSALEQAETIELNAKKLKEFSEYCSSVGIDFFPIRKKIGIRNNENYKAIECPLVLPKKELEKDDLDKWLENKPALNMLKNIISLGKCNSEDNLFFTLDLIYDNLNEKNDSCTKSDKFYLEKYFNKLKDNVIEIGKKINCNPKKINEYIHEFKELTQISAECAILNSTTSKEVKTELNNIKISENEKTTEDIEKELKKINKKEKKIKKKIAVLE